MVLCSSEKSQKVFHSNFSFFSPNPIALDYTVYCFNGLFTLLTGESDDSVSNWSNWIYRETIGSETSCRYYSDDVFNIHSI